MSKSEQREALRIISDLLNDPYNRICADCQCKPSEWASTSLGVFICINCSGVHRSLGTHISFVRSCTLDTWTYEQAKLMQGIGNKIANSYWEARMPDNFVRPDESNRSLMELFIRQKYAMKKWAADGMPPHLVWKSTPHNSEMKQRTRKKKNKTGERQHRAKNQTEVPKESSKLVFDRVDKSVEKSSNDNKNESNDQGDNLDSFFSEVYVPHKRNMVQPYKPHQRKVVEFRQDRNSEIDSFFAEEYLHRKKLNDDEAEKRKKQKIMEEQLKNDEIKDIGSVDLSDINEFLDSQSQNAEGIIEERYTQNLNPKKEVKKSEKPKIILDDVKFVNLENDKGDLTKLQNFFDNSTQEAQSLNEVKNLNDTNVEEKEKDTICLQDEQSEKEEEEQKLNEEISHDLASKEKDDIYSQNDHSENKEEEQNLNDDMQNQQQDSNKQSAEATEICSTNQQNIPQISYFTDQSLNNESQETTNLPSKEEITNETKAENQDETDFDFFEKKTNSDSELYSFFETEYKEAKELLEKGSYTFFEKSDGFDEIDDFFFDAELNMAKPPKHSYTISKSASTTKEPRHHSHRKKQQSTDTPSTQSTFPTRSSLAPVQRRAGNYLPKRLQRKIDVIESAKPKKRHRH